MPERLDLCRDRVRAELRLNDAPLHRQASLLGQPTLLLTGGRRLLLPFFACLRRDKALLLALLLGAKPVRLRCGLLAGTLCLLLLTLGGLRGTLIGAALLFGFLLQLGFEPASLHQVLTAGSLLGALLLLFGLLSGGKQFGEKRLTSSHRGLPKACGSEHRPHGTLTGVTESNG